MNKQPIDYAKLACDTMMRKYAAPDLPPKGLFHYHQGVFLSGMYKIYLLTNEEPYFQYIKDWVDSNIDEQGQIRTFDSGSLDDIQPGILLYPLYDRTGDERYKQILDTLLPLVLHFPRTPEGGLWHRAYLDHQMWLDGLYMGGPISAEYGKRFQKPEYTDMVVQHVRVMFEKTKDNETGLLYHAWDASKQSPWANPKTGLSPEFWGRSVGWVPMAILDDMDFMDKHDPRYREMAAYAVDLLKAVCTFQSEDGRWYQVLNKPNEAGNWLENSCSCLFAGAISKAVRLGLLKPEYLAAAEKGYQGVIRSLTWDNADLLIGNVCIGTGVGDYKHYCDRPVSVNDLHGVGAFLLMCAELQMALNESN